MRGQVSGQIVRSVQSIPLGCAKVHCGLAWQELVPWDTTYGTALCKKLTMQRLNRRGEHTLRSGLSSESTAVGGA